MFKKKDWGIETGRMDTGILRRKPQVTINVKGKDENYVLMKTTKNYMILAKTSKWGRFIFDSAQKLEINKA